MICGGLATLRMAASVARNAPFAAISLGEVTSGPTNYLDRDRPPASVRRSSSEDAQKAKSFWPAKRTMVSDLRLARSSLATNFLLLLIERVLLTSAVDTRSVEMRNTVRVSAAPRSTTELGARLLSSSPVMVVRGDPLGLTNWLSFS